MLPVVAPAGAVDVLVEPNVKSKSIFVFDMAQPHLLLQDWEQG